MKWVTGDPHLIHLAPGYDTGYISAVLVTINESLGHTLSSSEQEMVTSLTSGGALVGAVGAGLTADRFGRRWPIWGACLTFVVGTVLQTCAFSVEQFATGRFIVGLGVGSASMIVPMYSEFPPFHDMSGVTDQFQSVNWHLLNTAVAWSRSTI